MLRDIIGVVAAEVGQSWKARHVHLACHAKRRLGQHTVAVDTDLDNAVAADVLVDSRVHGHGFGSLGMVRVGGSKQAVEIGHDLIDKHSHDREELAVVVDRRDWVAGYWVVGYKEHLEANARLERAEAGVRSGRVVVEKRQ